VRAAGLRCVRAEMHPSAVNAMSTAPSTDRMRPRSTETWTSWQI
jgi:hypothetical protein